ncbi:MAG: response regulator [Acidobacteriota bacterium]|nr:response regulator [Acidobacteriota bacterium]
MAGCVLLVDDSSVMRKVVHRTLKMAGMEFDEVLEAGDGAEALQRLDGKHVDLVLCDINMPNMSGLEFVAAMRTTMPEKKAPVVMVTTEGSEAQVKLAIAAGATAYVRKPFSVQDFERSVKPLVAR